jgi:hypothetical protein
MSIHELENVFLFKRNLKFPQPREVFILECSSSMMLFLILKVANDRAELRMSLDFSVQVRLFAQNTQ